MPLPLRSLVAALRDLAKEDAVPFRVSGDCMAPLFVNGARVEVQAERVYLPGDVVAVLGRGGRILVHRFLGYVPEPRGLFVVTQADDADAPDGRVPADAIIGKVTGTDPSAEDRARAGARFLRWFAASAHRRLCAR